jgi:hypothetical protein
VLCATEAVAAADSTRARIAKIGPCMGSLIVRLDIEHHVSVRVVS